MLQGGRTKNHYQIESIKSFIGEKDANVCIKKLCMAKIKYLRSFHEKIK